MPSTFFSRWLFPLSILLIPSTFFSAWLFPPDHDMFRRPQRLSFYHTVKDGYWLQFSLKHASNCAKCTDIRHRIPLGLFTRTILGLFSSLSRVIEDDYLHQERKFRSRVDRKLRRMIMQALYLPASFPFSAEQHFAGHSQQLLPVQAAHGSLHIQKAACCRCFHSPSR